MSQPDIHLLYTGKAPGALDSLVQSLSEVHRPARYFIRILPDIQAAIASLSSACCSVIVLSVATASALDDVDTLMSAVSIPVIVVGSGDAVDLADETLRRGANDFLPFEADLNTALLDRAVRHLLDVERLSGTLYESTDRFQLITENAADMISRHTPTGEFTYVSPASFPLLGYQSDELIGLNPRELFHPEDLDAIRESYQLVLTTAARSTSLYRIRGKDGRYVWFETTARAVRDQKSGEVIEIITASRDVTERKSAQDMLRASQERFSRVFRASPVAISITRIRDEKIIDVNDSYVRMLGFDRDEIIGNTGLGLNMWVDPGHREQLFNDLRRGRSVRDVEMLFRKGGVEQRDGQMSVEVVDLDGEPCLLTMMSDITARKQAEKEIRDSERLARSTLDALTAHVAILDHDGSIVAVNRAWVQSASHMCWTAGIGEGAAYLEFCESATGETTGPYGRAIASGIRGVMARKDESFSLEYHCYRGLDEIFWYVVNVTPYPEDSRYSVVVAHTDITDRKRAESAQRASEDRFRHALDHLPDAFVIHDGDERIRFINARARKMIGVSEEEILGKRREELPTKQNVEKYVAMLKAAIATGQLVRDEFTLATPNGMQSYINTFAPQIDQDGRVDEVLCLIHDITDRKLIEVAEQEQRNLAEALRDTSAFVSSTLDLRTVMTRILNNVGRVVAHDAANIMLIEGNVARVAYWQGYSAAYDDVFSRTRYALSLPKIQQMMTTGLPMLAPDIATDPDWVDMGLPEMPRSSVGVPIRSRNQVIGFLFLDNHVGRPFTEADADRLRAFADHAAIAIENAQLYETMRYYAAELEERVEQRTAELQRAKEHVEAILNSRSDAVILTFLTGIVRQTNPAFSELFGYDAQESIGASIEMLSDDGSANLLLALNEVIESNQPRRLECRMRRRDGSAFDADTIISPLHNGKLFGIVCSVRDISARKQMEKDLRRAVETERELGELKSRFVSMASHEFRTPLTTIMASSDLLRRYNHKMNEERRNEHFEIIEDNIRHLTRMIDDVLTIGRADANHLDVHLVPVEVVQFCQEIISEMVSGHHDGESEIHFHGALESITMLADRKLLRQVIANLLTNAVKYSPQATPVYFSVRLDQDAGDIVFTVKDSGIGIPPKDQEHLFEAFHRGTNVESIEGNGLGLAIIQRAVTLHKGSISLESTVGVGTTFVVRFPTSSLGEPT